MGLIKKFRKSLDKKQEKIRNHQNQDDSDLYSPDEDVRVKAISKIKDNDALLDFALNDSNIKKKRFSSHLPGIPARMFELQLLIALVMGMSLRILQRMNPIEKFEE